MSLNAGSRIAGEGTLLVDDYAWVEDVDERDDPPDLFFDLVVQRIRRVEIPERFIKRSGKTKSAPARLRPSDFGPITELETMIGQRFSDELYLLDFEITNQRVPRTFLG